MDRIRVLENACFVLAAIVREEYGDNLSLAEIASTWTPVGVTRDQIDCLVQVEDAWSDARAEA